ncbi:vascular cell adhesion protein 1 [Epinephelus lanceolatus]
MCSSSILPLRMMGLIMLMISLCDANSTCPTDLNPLTLEPDKVLEEYGGTVSVNCTSAEEYHDGMYWRVGYNVSEIEYDSQYISWSVPLSDWNVTTECRVKLTGNVECSKDLEITLYKNPEMVDLFPTKNAPASEGTPYELQCNVDNVAPVQNLTVRWYKNNQTIRTDSFTNTTKTPVNESSILAVHLSRDENGAKLRCEAQLDFGSYGSQPPVISNTYPVSVNYAPELMNQTEDVFVNEGDNVTLHCEAEGRPPPVFSWTHDGTVISENTNIISITGATSTTYNCTARNYLGSITKQIHVHVTKTIRAAAPAAPAAITTPVPSTPKACPLELTPAEVVVQFGDSASINCSTSDDDIFGIGWEAILGGTGLENPPSVLWMVKKLEDWTIKPLCYITRKDNSQCSLSATITLYKTPDTVSLSALHQGPMMEGTEYTLKCDILNVAPVQKLKLKWYHNNENVHTEMFSDTSITPVNVSSTLRVTAERGYNGAQFRCEAELHLGPNGPEIVPTVTSVPYIAAVHYKPLIQDCPSNVAGVEHKLNLNNLTCRADGNPPPIVQWYHKGQLMDTSQPLDRTQSGGYTAEFVNVLGKNSTSVDITVEYGPSFVCDKHYEVEENGKVPCEPMGIPKPIITWHKDGKKMDSPQRWTKHDSGTYSLEATNKHGTANHTFDLDVLYAPAFVEGASENEKEVTSGENVTLDCSAEGNPPPSIQWSYTFDVNVRETTRGRQKSIIVTRATSTNAGVYICVATNKVGNVTRSVNLMMKGKNSAFSIAGIWWWLIVLIIVGGIIIAMIVVHVHRKKQGQYSFVSDGSDRPIPMTTQSNGVQG